ncbi:hypothetical protein CAPTEDRAFT_207424 [Capitella teleta]|uniref:Uncharacterized protein n=1 Tax=Capitella teleta TaxID=283909 RepID=R7TM28_CAPTE|nr:hypothetical protein CAPTEDRAFT_207424 [Capitella teleta]|eukprot:ELT94587.1 hypothetical protein CAPTEDRAFT_207424 [Capitella teleta]
MVNQSDLDFHQNGPAISFAIMDNNFSHLPSLDDMMDSLDWTKSDLDILNAYIMKLNAVPVEAVSPPPAMEVPKRVVTPPPPETCALSLDMSFSEVFEKYLNRAPEESPEESSVPVDSSPPEQEVSPSQDATNAPPPQDPLTTQATASLSVYVEPLIDLPQVSDPPRTSSVQPTTASPPVYLEPHVDIPEISDLPQPVIETNCVEPTLPEQFQIKKAVQPPPSCAHVAAAAPIQDPLVTQSPHIFSDIPEIWDPPQLVFTTNLVEPVLPRIQPLSKQPRIMQTAVQPQAPRDTAPAQKRRRSQPVNDAVGNKENQPPVTKRRRVDAVRQSSDLRPQLMPQQNVLAAPAPVSCAPSASLVQLSRRLQRRLKDVQHYGPLARQLSDFYAKQAQNIEADRRKFLAACPAPERASHIHRFYDSSHSDLIQKIDRRIEILREERVAHEAQQERMRQLYRYMSQQDGQ